MSAIDHSGDLDQLLACPVCDCLHRFAEIEAGTTARCARCHAVLLRPRQGAVAVIVSLSIAALALMVSAVSFPFLRIERSGFGNDASVIDATMAFHGEGGAMALISLVIAALIVLVPAARLAGLVYALGPVAFGRAPARFAPWVFRKAMRLRPWAMAEIFIIGVAVALIKIISLASVGIGPAFWAFTGLVMLIAVQDTLICERSLWRILGRS